MRYAQLVMGPAGCGKVRMCAMAAERARALRPHAIERTRAGDSC